MRIERLFNVLVLGGAALTVGCGNESPDSGGAGSSGAGGASTDAGAGGAAAGDANTGGTGGATAGGTAGATAGSSGELECRLDSLGRGNPADPCGCPCCWALDCLNTDDCCRGFCGAGNDGGGCCDQ
jgi:hypothetical protein